MQLKKLQQLFIAAFRPFIDFQADSRLHMFSELGREQAV
jgi:hypothetical protein